MNVIDKNGSSSLFNKSDVVRALWRSGRLNYKLHEGQLKIKQQIEDLPAGRMSVVLYISRQFGKTYMLTAMAIEDCIRNPGCSIYIVASSKADAYKIVRPKIDEISADSPPGLIRPTKSEGLWNVGKSQLHLIGWENIETMRGKSNERVYFEETGSFRCDKDDFLYKYNSVVLPTLTHAKDGKIFHATTPPKLADHPVATVLLPLAAKTNSLFEAKIYDNPLLNEAQIEEIISLYPLGKLDPDFQREYELKLIRDESLVVVPEFNEDDFVFEHKTPRHNHWTSALDFGGVRDKHGIVDGYYDFKNAFIYVNSCSLLDINTKTTDIIDEAKKLWGLREESVTSSRNIVDAAGQLRVDLASIGFPAYFPDKSKGFEANINYLRALFQERKIGIHPRCKDLIAVLKYGVLNERRTDFARSSDYGHMDLLAALMYFVRNINKMNPFPRFGDIRFDDDRAVPQEYEPDTDPFIGEFL